MSKWRGISGLPQTIVSNSKPANFEFHHYLYCQSKVCMTTGTKGVSECKGQILYSTYREFHQLVDLDWSDFDLGSSAICPTQPRRMGFWQKWLNNWARWKNIPNLCQPNPSPRADGTPCIRTLLTHEGNHDAGEASEGGKRERGNRVLEVAMHDRSFERNSLAEVVRSLKIGNVWVFCTADL